MKIKFYLLPILLFLLTESYSQSCSTLSVSYTSNESRCVATGSLVVNVSGGSGSYTYKAVGPITTPTTSSSSITGLPPGNYSIQVKDLTTGCTVQVDNAVIAGTYEDPRFQLTKVDAGCAGNDGTISIFNQQFGLAPFTYTIIAPSPTSVGTSNSTGDFTGLSSGEYFIQLTDSCGGIQVRSITIESYEWWFEDTNVDRLDCDSANVFIMLEDNEGNSNLTGTTFNGFIYGVVLTPGDTIWSTEHDFNVFLGTNRNMTLVTKDPCGNIKTTPWSLPSNQKPSLGNVSKSNYTCTDFRASVSGQNLTNPDFCLYDDNDVLIECNATGIFNNVPYGDYCIKVTDLCYDTTITRCFTGQQAVPGVAANVQITNRNCSGFTATITGKTNLTLPTFCLYDDNEVLIECNATGIFNNVPYGDYCIEIEDGCADTTIQRCFTVTEPVGSLSGYSISGANCATFNVSASGNNLFDPLYCLYDEAGNIISCDSSGVFTGLPHGSYCIRAISCGDTTNSICFTGSGPVPSVGANVQITNKACSTFTATITGQVNLIGAEFCLYSDTDSLISCNTSGEFTDILYGSYCIKVEDGCVDTVITRCFSASRTMPSVNANLQLLNSNCSTITIKANGSNLIDPGYCLYDETGTMIDCNTTGVFDDLPYGEYCIEVKEECADTIFMVCGTFEPESGMSLTTSKVCEIGFAYIDALFENNNSPYNVKVYHPNGSLVSEVNSSSNPVRVEVAALPAGALYKVIGTDDCGNVDSAFIAPLANVVTISSSLRAKCPSAAWLNGSGDILASYTSNHYSVTPKIIKKNGASQTINYSSVSSGVYTFADLEPAEYIIEYKQQICNSYLYDTVVVPPYAYPTQGQSAIYQCDNNSFSLGADVAGGVSPYNFQIIGSMPSTPDITTPLQSTAVFTINTGTVYSLVRLRTIDACGNATLSDVSVLPLQNISITASATCFYQDITLSVDTIPNATYLWYRKNTPVDSVLLDSGLTYNLPFFEPEQIGEYICKVIVNDGCVTRLSYFDLDGNCDEEVLSSSVQLKGKKNSTYNQLSWTLYESEDILKFIVERRTGENSAFTQIGRVSSNSGSQYFFNDNNPLPGTNIYRLRIVYADKTIFSNEVNISSGHQSVKIYPNPVKDVLTITDLPQNCIITIHNEAGSFIFKKKSNNASSLIIPRPINAPRGLYLISINDVDANKTEIRKLLFE